jgi:hypothetical protein
VLTPVTRSPLSAVVASAVGYVRDMDADVGSRILEDASPAQDPTFSGPGRSDSSGHW